MNKRQIKDSDRCEELSEKGEDIDCLGCSCNVCIAQESNPSNDTKITELRLLLEEKDYQINNLKLKHHELQEASNITLKAYEVLYNAVDEMFATICNEWDQYMEDEGKNADIEQLVGDLRKIMYGDDDNE